MNVDGPDGGWAHFKRPRIEIFTPWGPRYDWESRGTTILPDHREVELLKFLAYMLKILQTIMPDRTFNWTFLAADLYGIRVNHLPEEAVNEYYASLEHMLAEYLPAAQLLCWSEFDEEAEPYRETVRKNFDQEFRPSLVRQAKKTASAMGRGGDATEYLVERLAEARLIQDLLDPVKFSCVARHKDQGVDGELPVFYFVPPELHAPWMG